jgi:hypothetical protein
VSDPSLVAVWSGHANMALGSPSSALPSCSLLVTWLSESLKHDLSLPLQPGDSLPFLLQPCARGLHAGTKTLRVHVKTVSNVELDYGYSVCGLKNFQVLYCIMDANDRRYVDHT